MRRGLSGRELLPEGNRYYLVVRSFRGEVFDPVRVFDSLSQAVPVVKPLGHPGNLSSLDFQACKTDG